MITIIEFSPENGDFRSEFVFLQEYNILQWRKCVFIEPDNCTRVSDAHIDPQIVEYVILSVHNGYLELKFEDDVHHQISSFEEPQNRFYVKTDVYSSFIKEITRLVIAECTQVDTNSV